MNIGTVIMELADKVEAKDAEIEKLKAEIESMKCCGNCYTTSDWHWTSHCYCYHGKQAMTPRTVCYKWEPGEKKESE